MSGVRASALLIPALMSSAFVTRAADTVEAMDSGTVRVLAKVSRGISAGSGFIVGNGQYVVTNVHVVNGAEAIIVRSRSLNIPVGRIVAASPEKDIAILELAKPSGHGPVSIAANTTIHVTQTV